MRVSIMVIRGRHSRATGGGMGGGGGGWVDNEDDIAMGRGGRNDGGNLVFLAFWVFWAA